MNTIIILGNVGKDPEMRFTPSGQAVCNVSVADSYTSTTGTGEKKEQTTWFKVIAWGKQAEALNQYVSKGDKIYVQGRLSESHWQSQQGEDRVTLEVNATKIEFLGKRSKEVTEDDEDFLK